MRVVAHPQLSRRRQCGDVGIEPAGRVEQFADPVGRQPVGQHLQVLRGVPRTGQWYLVRPPRPGGLLAVDVGRSGPALGMAEDDHRPLRTGVTAAGGGCLGLDHRDLVEDVVE